MIKIKIDTHILTAQISDCIIATETVICMIVTERSSTVTESTTCTIVIEPQNLHNYNRCCHLHNCYRKWRLHSSNRNCHLQNWLQKPCQSEILLVTIKKLSESVSTNSFSFFFFQFSYLHTFYKSNSIKTDPSAKAETYFQI